MFKPTKLRLAFLLIALMAFPSDAVAGPFGLFGRRKAASNRCCVPAPCNRCCRPMALMYRAVGYGSNPYGSCMITSGYHPTCADAADEVRDGASNHPGGCNLVYIQCIPVWVSLTK